MKLPSTIATHHHHQHDAPLPLWRHLQLVFGPLLEMIRYQPEVILYFEPHSSFPVYLYKRWFHPKVRIFIHNHEYYAKEQFFEQGMRLVRYFHQKEITYLYKQADWISQTNIFRLELFAQDYPFISPKVLRTLANYPPKSWRHHKKEKQKDKRIRFLYIGALSFENTYIKEMVEFISANSNCMSLTIYSNNIKEKVRQYLYGFTDKGVKLEEEGVNYDDIPQLAPYFDIGLVLYNAHNLNYKYNAPNKLFEYLALDLHVWVPDVLEGCKPYLREDIKPVIRSISFDNLDGKFIDFDKIEDVMEYIPTDYFCETEIDKLLSFLILSNNKKTT